MDNRLYKIIKREENCSCVDCGSNNNLDWVSNGFAIVICIECAGFHRELGVHVSKVQSICLDDWSNKMKEIDNLDIGGNNSFQSYLNDNKLNEFDNLQDKYRNPLVLYYIEILSSRSQKREPLPYLESEWSDLVSLSPIKSNKASNSEKLKASQKWNNDTKLCELCSKTFSLFVRRHHCRRCGKCCCSTCAPHNNTRPIMEHGLKEPQRHCKNCYKSPLVDWN